MKYQFVEMPTFSSEENQCLLAFSTKKSRFHGVSENLKSALMRLQEPLDEEEIPTLFDNQNELIHFYSYLSHMNKHALLSYSVIEEGAMIALLEPRQSPFDFSSQLVKGPYSLSRFCVIHTENETLILESAKSGAILRLSEKVLPLIFALAKSRELEELKEKAPLSEEGLKDLLLLLQNGNMLSVEEEPYEAFWEMHDLYFHQKTRNRFDSSYGGTFRFEGIYPPLPALKEVEGERIPLYRPSMEEVLKNDPPFSQVLEERRSVRKGLAPLSDEALGEFLYRVARVKGEVQEGRYDVTKRPYPGGGACYELEIYPLIQGKGLFYYHPKEHALILVEKDQKKLDAFLQGKTHGFDTPHVYFGITARFGRMTWKYEKMAYAVIMKNLGVLYQTMYLVGTAMGLAPSAIGGGASTDLNQLTGEDFLKESQVGEFLLSAKCET